MLFAKEKNLSRSISNLISKNEIGEDDDKLLARYVLGLRIELKDKLYALYFNNVAEIEVHEDRYLLQILLGLNQLWEVQHQWIASPFCLLLRLGQVLHKLPDCQTEDHLQLLPSVGILQLVTIAESQGTFQ